jgi:hypothetical protein
MAVPDPQGWKEVSVNEVETSAGYQGYVLQQIIAVFADATARDAAITEPKHGQHAFLKDTDTLTRYNGAAWVAAGGTTSLNAAALAFVEGGVHKAFHGLGAASAKTTFADATRTGMGYEVLIANTGTVRSSEFGDAQIGAWKFQTDTTSASMAGVLGTRFEAASDWTLVWRGVIEASADQTVMIGFKGTQNFADNNDIIAFRVLGTGNVVGVCDNSGTETTRDTGADGATEMTLRIEVREGGTVVRFFKNDVQVGADVTTNINANAATLVCGITNSTTANKRMWTYDLFGWREA